MSTRNFAGLKGLWHSLARDSRGLTLIEVVIAVALLGSITTAFVTALSTGFRISRGLDEAVVSTSVGTAQLEDTLAQGYVEPPDYPVVTTPEGYSVTLDNTVVEPTLKERIKVVVTSDDDTVFEVSTHKANEAFAASPPTTLFSQRDFRFYTNNFEITPVDALTVENTPHSPTTVGFVVRLRMSVQVAFQAVPVGTRALKLQFATNSDGPWTDVGAKLSGEVWRFASENATTTTGTPLPALLLTESDVAGTYEETNPSVVNPNAVAINEWIEYDWILEENDAAIGASYFFRMLESDDTAFGSYTRFPLIIMPPALDLAQEEYRWYSNEDDVVVTTSLAAVNTVLGATALAQDYRLRMSVGADGQDLVAGSQAFKLQFATSTSGPWTDVGSTTSTETWRGLDNATPADGTTITQVALSNSTVGESYEEANPSVANPVTIPVSGFGEWDWALNDNGALASTTYYFRMVSSNGDALDAYTRYPAIQLPAAQQLTGDEFRWYANADSVVVTSTLATLNTAATGIVQGEVLRLRTAVSLTGAALLAGTEGFKLQYATNVGGPWTDVGAPGSGTIWRGFDNPTPVDGSTLGSIVLPASTVAETYEEANPSATIPNAIGNGAVAEWDWAIENNGAAASTTYYFRMLRDDDTALDSYVRYPELATRAAEQTQNDYRWYANADSIAVTTTLSALNSVMTGVEQLDVLRLRMNVTVDGINLSAGSAAFKLQYAETTTGPWTDVGATGSEVTWRGFDNPTPLDGSGLGALALASSDVGQSYEEANPSVANPNVVTPGQQAEWDWVVQNQSDTATTYFFRMVDSGGTPLDNYTNYPQASTVVPDLTQRDWRWFANADSVAVTTTLAALNTAGSGIVPQEVVRLRVNVEAATSALVTSSQAFLLQFSTSTSGFWQDVGSVTSSAVWKGFDNPTPIDGSQLGASQLGTSNVLETYEEANPSVLVPASIVVGERGEWDWVLLNNTAPADTYFFRMVRSDGTPLSAYAATYPEIGTIESQIAQEDYRWYRNEDVLTTTSAFSAENNPATSTAHGLAYRLRMNLEITGVTLPVDGQAFKLQFAISASGPWTDVGATSSVAIWRGHDNASLTDGTTLLGSLLSSSNVAESYEAANPSALNPNPITNGQRAEWDWAIEDNGAADSTTYFFRMVKSDDAAFDTYARYPQLLTPPARTHRQEDYRWYQNRDGTHVVDPLAAENTAHTGAGPQQIFRLRMNLETVGADFLTSTETFKLQFATSTTGTWSDVGAPGSTSTWRGYDNVTTTASDGVTLTSTVLTTSDVFQTYEEQNPTTSNPNQTLIGERAEWDWVLQNNTAPLGDYFLRMVLNDGTPLGTYTPYPQISAVAAQLDQRDWRWYTNRDQVDPAAGASLAVENTAYVATTIGLPYRLRVNVQASAQDLTAGTLAFKLQYATDKDGPWSDVGGLTSTTSAWRGYDNPSVADGATIGAQRLTTTDVSESYEETNPSVSLPGTILDGQRGEWDWVVIDGSPLASQTYYFRMVREDGNALTGYDPVPYLTSTPAQILTQEDYRWYENRDNDVPNVALAVQTTPFTSTLVGQVIRLRMNVLAGGANFVDDLYAFKLQYSVTTTGGWTDVGGLTSTSTWRGFDNPSEGDGDTDWAPLLTTSFDNESYEETNPSIPAPVGLLIGQRGEWDWVLAENSAPANTTYYFRMVYSDGTALTTYTNYPQMTTAPDPIISQEDYLWFGNRDNADPALGDVLAAENTSVTGTTPGLVYHLRMNVEITGSTQLVGTQAYKLQYSTDSGGPWLDVGGSGSGQVWRGFDNPSAADGDTTIASRLTTTNVDGSYEEFNPSVANGTQVDPGQRAEYGWVLEENSAPQNTTYFFRMVKSAGTALDTYTNYPEFTTPDAPGFDEQDYRWYRNRDDVNPANTAAMAAENAPATLDAHNAVWRLRTNLLVSDTNLVAGSQAFKLQFAVTTTGPWTDVGGSGSATIWRGFDNPTAVDGTSALADRLGSDVDGSYEEFNPSVANVNPVDIGQLVEYDWVVEDNGAADNTAYFFRMVLDDGTALDTYTNYPQLTTPPSQTFDQLQFRWFHNDNDGEANDLTPHYDFAPLNNPLTSTPDGVEIRLRVNAQVGGLDLPDDSQQFKLQYATNNGGPWTDVGGLTSTTPVWRGFDNTSVTDGATIQGAANFPQLSLSTVRMSFEESNNSIENPNPLVIGDIGEWDWVIQSNGVAANTTYWFRMVLGNGDAFATYTVLPYLTTTHPTVAHDDFESQLQTGGTGWNAGWTFSGSVSYETGQDPAQDDVHLRLRQSTGQIERSVDISGKTSARVQFWLKVPNNWEAGDEAALLIDDGGGGYFTLNTWTLSDADNDYRYYDYDLSGHGESFTSDFRIRIDANMNSGTDHLFIDDLRVVGQ